MEGKDYPFLKFWKFLKIFENFWKYLNILKFLKIFENFWKYLKIFGGVWKFSENYSLTKAKKRDIYIL